MKEPSRDKKIALAFAVFHEGKTFDWSRDVKIYVYMYNTKNQHMYDHWKCDYTEQFTSLEEAMMYCSISGLPLYKLKNYVDNYFAEPKTVYFPENFCLFTSPNRILRILEKKRKKNPEKTGEYPWPVRDS